MGIPAARREILDRKATRLMKAVIAAAPAAHRPEGDSPSLTDLHPLALGALARALQSDDEKVALRAAQVVLSLVRQSLPPTLQKAKVITIQYGDDPPIDPSAWAANRPEQPRALQSGGLRTTLGQDGNGEDSRD